MHAQAAAERNKELAKQEREEARQQAALDAKAQLLLRDEAANRAARNAERHALVCTCSSGYLQVMQI